MKVRASPIFSFDHEHIFKAERIQLWQIAARVKHNYKKTCQFLSRFLPNGQNWCVMQKILHQAGWFGFMQACR
jgi:hypothetical protein